MKNRSLVVLAFVSSIAIACGSSTTDPAPAVTPPVATTPPAATASAPPVVKPPPPLDHGAVSTKYPAFTPSQGQIITDGGPILKNPVIITVTFPGDPDAASFETFGDTIGAGNYWKAITSEYGASAATSGAANHLRLTDPAPAAITDTQLASFIATSLAAPGTVWPIPATGDPVYILYLAATTTLTLQGEEVCGAGVGGYHDSTNVNGKPVAYAIIPRCGGAAGDLTFYASHELDEATTDPFPNGRSAYHGFRDEDVAWEIFLEHQDEVGDACEFYADSELDPGDSTASLPGYAVQRQWSNASGMAGHDPCVPELKGEVYFNMTPLDTEDIQINIGGNPIVTKGYAVKAGQTRKIPLGFYSADATKAWKIKAVTSSLGGGPSGDAIVLSLDTAQGQNGQKAYLTVTVNAASGAGFELVTLVSTLDGTEHYMPFLIGSN